MRHISIVTTAIAMSAIASPSFGQSNVTVTGYLDASVIVENGGAAGSVTKLGSGVSGPTRLMFRGREEIGGGYSADFLLDAQIHLDTGAQPLQSFFGRQAYVGLGTPFGSFRLGLVYTPVFLVLRDVVDPFRTAMAGNSGNLMTAAAAAGPNSVAFPNASVVTGPVATGGANRANTIQYALPAYQGFTADVAYSLGEQADSSDKLSTFGASAGYQSGPLTARIAYSNTNDATGTDHARNVVLGVKYNLGPALMHFGAGTNRGLAAFNNNDYLIGITVPMGRTNLLASYVVKDDKSSRNNNAKQVAIGATYNLSKRTLLHASVAAIQNSVSNTQPGFYTIATPAGFGTGNRMVSFGIGHWL